MKNERLSSLPVQAAADPASPVGDGSLARGDRRGRGGGLGRGRLGGRRRAGFGGRARLDGRAAADGAATEGEWRRVRREPPPARYSPRRGRPRAPGGAATGGTDDGPDGMRRRRARSRSRHGREGSTRAGSPSSERTSTRMDVAGSSDRDGVGREGARERHGMTDGPGMGDDHGGPATRAKRGPCRRDPRAQIGGRLAARPVDVRDTARQCLGELRFQRRQLVERAPFGDPEIGLPPALVDLDVRDPGGRREDLRGGARAARRARRRSGRRVAGSGRAPRPANPLPRDRRRPGAGRCARSTGGPSSSSTRGGRTRPRS